MYEFDVQDCGRYDRMKARSWFRGLPRGRTLPEDAFETRHRWFVRALWLHAAGFPLLALGYGDPLWHAVLEGGIIAAFAIVAGHVGSDHRVKAVTMAFGLMTCSAVLVHITDGLVESHFHFFVVVTALSLYEDWLVFGLAIGYVLAHHGLAQSVLDVPVFNHGGDPWRWAAVHTGFIAALSAVNVMTWLAAETVRGKVAASELRYRTLLDALEEGVVLIAPDGAILTTNPSAQRILDLPETGATVMDWHPLDNDGKPLPDERRPHVITRRTGAPCTGVEIGLRRADGGITWLSKSTRAIGPAPPYGVVCSFVDVTERREAEQALAQAAAEIERHAEELERSNEELEQFAYVASHDLSEPLRMVTSYLQLLERRHGKDLDDDAKQFIGFAVDGAGRMRTLIDDLLAYSRAGAARPSKQPVDVRATVDSTLRSLSAALEDAEARVEVQEELPVVQGDPVAIGQLFQNLISNAVKFRNGVRPHVKVEAEAADGEWVFSVTDNGIGIQPEHAERIFTMFQRLHTRDDFAGNGIGLSICRKIVERHGGRIWVEPAEGGGSRFAFTIPRG